jgi:hypothetical protein
MSKLFRMSKYFNSIILLFIFLATFNGCRSNTRSFQDNYGYTELSDLCAKEENFYKYMCPRDDAKFFAFLNLDYPGIEKVKRYVRKNEWNKAKEEYLKFRREISKAKWYIDPADKPLTPIAQKHPQEKSIMNNIIAPALGAPEVILPEIIDWEYNPVDPSQPNFTREWTWATLNRMYFWETTGTAYWHTLDEKYVKKWMDQMVDWVEKNTVPLDAEHNETLTWRTIEAGIRMSGSWINSYYRFLNSPTFTADAHATFVKGVIEHAQRLEKITVDQPKRTSNWVIMECNGLGTISLLFPELKLAEHYRKVAFDKLMFELDNQVYPDGAQIELTPAYHHVSQNNFMRLAKLAQMNDVQIPYQYLDKLRKMYKFNLYMMDPSGILPPFNDARPLNAIPSLKEAYSVWGDKEFLFGATLGKEGVKPEFDSYYFNWAGYYVMRSGWDYNSNCLYFDAGPVGHGHEHEDMLNIYLYSNGKILLTEAGNYAYDLSKWRRYAISSLGHNTIIVNGKEQHRRGFPGGRVTKEPLKNPWITSPIFDFGSGEYSSGYQENKYVAVQYRPREYIGKRNFSIKHTRSVIFLKPYYYLVIDFLKGEGENRYDALFHLNATDAEIFESRKEVHTKRSDTVQLGLYSMDTVGLNIEIVKGQEEPLLGWIAAEKRPIPTVVFTKKEEAPSAFSTFLYPYTNTKPNVSFTTIMEDSKIFWGKRITTPHETLAVLLKKGEEQANSSIISGMIPEFITNAQGIVIRRPNGKKDNYLGLIDFSEYTGDNLTFNLENQSSLIMIKGSENNLLFFNPRDEEIKISFSRPIKDSFSLNGKKWMHLTTTGFQEVGGIKVLFE